MELCGIYVPESLIHGKKDEFRDATQTVLAFAEGQHKLNWVAESLMEKISYGQSTRGVVAEFVRPNASLKSLSLPKNPLILVLDEGRIVERGTHDDLIALDGEYAELHRSQQRNETT